MESFVNFVVIIAIGVGLAWYDMRFFAVYALAATIGLMIYFSGRLWKLITVNQTLTNVKILAIAQKVGISEEGDVPRAVEIQRRLS
jgi:hypothetical protein